MDNGQQLCRVSKQYAKMPKYRYINQTKFKKLFARTICYMHVVNLYLHVTRILTNVHVIFSGMYTNSYVLNKNHFANRVKKYLISLILSPTLINPYFRHLTLIYLALINVALIRQIHLFQAFAIIMFALKDVLLNIHVLRFSFEYFEE